MDNQLTEVEQESLRLHVEFWFREQGKILDTHTIIVCLQILPRLPKVTVHFGESVPDPEVERILNLQIGDLNLIANARNALALAHLNTVRQIVVLVNEQGWRGLLRVRNFGMKGFLDVRDRLTEAGLRLGPQWEAIRSINHSWVPSTNPNV